MQPPSKGDCAQPPCKPSSIGVVCNLHARPFLEGSYVTTMHIPSTVDCMQPSYSLLCTEACAQPVGKSLSTGVAYNHHTGLLSQGIVRNPCVNSLPKGLPASLLCKSPTGGCVQPPSMSHSTRGGTQPLFKPPLTGVCVQETPMQSPCQSVCACSPHANPFSGEFVCNPDATPFSKGFARNLLLLQLDSQT